MEDEKQLKQCVRSFQSIWFPECGKNQPFWFRARMDRYKTIMLTICDSCAVVLGVIEENSPHELLHNLQSLEWTQTQLITLSIMFDQIPRNALAIGYGQYSGCDPKSVSRYIDDTFSISFAKLVLPMIHLKSIIDDRILCFYSLIFRHSNDFLNARKILLASTSGDIDELSPLALKFWDETSKRENMTSL